MLKKLTIALVIVTLAACGTTSHELRYAASSGAVRTTKVNASVATGDFVDSRGEPVKWIGAIRGGYGNPLKVLETDKPVADVVRHAFEEGLRARGIAPMQSPVQRQLTGVIRKLDCSQYVRREANVEIEVTVLDSQGHSVFVRSYSSTNIDGSLLNLKTGVFAAPEDLRAVLEQTLRETIDKALDDGALRAALQS